MNNEQYVQAWHHNTGCIHTTNVMYQSAWPSKQKISCCVRINIASSSSSQFCFVFCYKDDEKKQEEML